MGNDYAKWDDGWTKDPPQPPKRPGLWEWHHMSEAQRQMYDAALTGYLMAAFGEAGMSRLTNWAMVYANAAQHGELGSGDEGVWYG